MSNSLQDTILHHLDVYAENIPQTCLDSPTSRALVAQHLAGNLAMWQIAKYAALVALLDEVRRNTVPEGEWVQMPARWVKQVHETLSKVGVRSESGKREV